MPRKEQLKTFVSAEEKERAIRIAAAEGLTISAYLRRCILLAPLPNKPYTARKA